MIRKLIALILFFYFLTVLQTSFLTHFNLFKWLPNLILTFVILFTFVCFWKSKKRQGIYYELVPTFIGGFFWDIFSGDFLGFHILILFVLVIFIKFIFKNYIQLPAAYG